LLAAASETLPSSRNFRSARFLHHDHRPQAFIFRIHIVERGFAFDDMRVGVD
jgi:hypothetical protein